jgi:hypothetical protein
MVDHFLNLKAGMDGPPTLKKRGRPPKQKPETLEQLATNGTQQTIGEDGESMSTSEDAPPKKRGRPPKQSQTSLPRVIGFEEPLAQSSIPATGTVAPLTTHGFPPELGDASFGNTVVSLQFHSEEARRSSRKRKPVVRDDNSISAKQTPRRKPVMAKATKAAQAIPQSADVDNWRVSVVPVEISQDRVLDQTISLGMGQAPMQSSGSQPIVHFSDSHVASTSVLVGPTRAIDSDSHDIRLKSNVGINIMLPCYDEF